MDRPVETLRNDVFTPRRAPRGRRATTNSRARARRRVCRVRSDVPARGVRPGGGAGHVRGLAAGLGERHGARAIAGVGVAARNEVSRAWTGRRTPRTRSDAETPGRHRAGIREHGIGTVARKGVRRTFFSTANVGNARDGARVLQ